MAFRKWIGEALGSVLRKTFSNRCQNRTDFRSRLASASVAGVLALALLAFALPALAAAADVTDPDTVIDSATPSSPTNQLTREFEFHGVDPEPSEGLKEFECQTDGGGWGTCSSPFETPTLGEGNHTFEVRAVDNAGNTDPTPASSSWMIDTTSPAIAISFPSNKEHLTLDSGVTPSYTCTDPISGGVSSGVKSCTDDGFSTEELGPHLFTVHAEDNAGNTKEKTVVYVVDPPRYANFLLEDEPIAYYRLNEALGSGSMFDLSGNGHDGEYKNGIVLERTPAPTCERRPHPPHACKLNGDPQDYAAYFPPRDGYGYVNGITAPTDEYSMEAWVKPTDGANMMIAAHGGGGQMFISGGHLAFRQTQDTIYSSGPEAAVPPGVWTHVAVSWDGHTSRLYVNGVQVASSTTANKAPSGTATFYVGYGDQAPWFHGYIDEVAYYDHALPADSFADHWEIGTAYDHASLTGENTSQTGEENTNTAKPYANIEIPVNHATYAPGKVPPSSFNCSDLDGKADIASCTAKVDGNAIESGAALPEALGSYEFTVTALDKGGNEYVHTHTYEIKLYPDVVRSDGPLAYYRLDDGSETMADDTGNHDGIYKNDQESGPVGISGDGNHARRFFGAGGYGYVNGIAAPPDSSSMEAWVNPDDSRNEAIMGHGDGGELDIIGGHFSYRRMDKTVTAEIGGECVGPTPGSWAHVVGTWDGVEQKIYVNGVLCGAIESTKRPSSISTFYVGYGELAPWFKGVIDEVGYYSTALSAERVYEHYIADPPADLSAGSSAATFGGGSAPAVTPSPTTSAGSSAAAGTAASSSTQRHRAGRRHHRKHRRHRWSHRRHRQGAKHRRSHRKHRLHRKHRRAVSASAGGLSGPPVE